MGAVYTFGRMPGGLLARTRMVLHEPRVPENVGSVARAMANFGLSRLIIAGSPGIKDDPAAQRLAVHCEGLLAAAREEPDFASAVGGAGLILGTTAHTAYERWDLLDPWQARSLAEGAGGEVALVFGSERYGLSRALLRRCDQVVHLPTAAPGQSLNLAQAVLVFCWEWSRPAVPTGPERPAAEVSLEALGPEWERLLEAAGALKPHNREQRLATLRRILTRLRPSPDEAALLRAIGSKLALLAGVRGTRKQS